MPTPPGKKNKRSVTSQHFPPPNNLVAPFFWNEFYETDRYLQKKRALKLNGVDIEPTINEILKYKLRRINLPKRYNDTSSPNKIGEIWLNDNGTIRLVYDYLSDLVLSDIRLKNDNIEAYDSAMKGIG